MTALQWWRFFLFGAWICNCVAF